MHWSSQFIRFSGSIVLQETFTSVDIHTTHMYSILLHVYGVDTMLHYIQLSLPPSHDVRLHTLGCATVQLLHNQIFSQSCHSVY